MPINNALTPEGLNALGAAFGFYPQLRRNRTVQDPRAALDMPVQALRGRVAATAGMPSDILNMLRTPMPMEMYGDVDYGPQTQVPYGSQELLKTLPLPPQGPAQQAAANLGALAPMTPAEALQAARLARQTALAGGRATVAGGKALAPVAGDMLMNYMVKQKMILPLDVYHGTPHRFPPTANNPLGEFDASKIGTGEGAQAYGHGIYTGGNIKTGEEYVKTTARTEIVDPTGKTLYKELPRRMVTGESRAADALDYAFQIQSSNPFAYAADQVRRFGEGPNVQAALKTLGEWEKVGARSKAGSGYLYKADLPDEKIAQMIDWYYPVQEDVRQKVSAAALEKFGSGSTGTSGAHLYAEIAKEFERLGSKNPKVDASEFLRQQGVSGIKYLDNFSRRQPEWIIQSPKGGQNIFNSEAGALEFLQRNPEGKMIPPAQTYNYVMFPGEEKNIKILERQDR
jgi:hypothetical protein